MKKTFLSILCCLFCICSGYLWAQELPFPYDIQVETIAGNCFDDSRAIITLWDAFGNEVVIDPATHHAANTAEYPLYNVQYHYRNQTAGTNTRYDTLNNIQLSAGTYCFGVVGYVPVTNGGVTTYELVDTTICNIVVPTHYNHLEASVLSGIAGNNVNGREVCGIHRAFECADIGRIQLRINYGNFPYRVQLYDENNSLMRDQYFYQRQNSGTNPSYADYMDFYTLDSLPAGDYRIVASDSCGYTIQLSINIPLTAINTQRLTSRYELYNCSDSNVIRFWHLTNWNNSIYNYEWDYIDHLLKYRFINPGSDTTQWQDIVIHAHGGLDNGGMPTLLPDTISTINRYCELLGDTVQVQVWDICKDALYTIRFLFGNSRPLSYRYESDVNILEPIVMGNDSCGAYVYSGKFTEVYIISGYVIADLANAAMGGVIYNESGIYYKNIAPHPVCPLSLDVYTEHDEILLAHAENQNFQDLSCAFTNPTNTDTTLVVHVVLRDAKGCIVNEFYREYEFTITVLDSSFSPYPYVFENDGYNCYYDRHFYLREKDVDFYQFRHNVTVRLIESPLYNHFNFTATYHNNAWDIVKEDPTNTSTNIVFSLSHGWRFRISDHNLATGRYVFVSTTECGVDTLTYLCPTGIHDQILAFDEEPQFTGVQVCDRYFVTPYSVGAAYQYHIDVNISNDEPIETRVPLTPSYSVVAGPANGWYYSNGQIVFTVPGTYVIGTELSIRNPCLQRIYHYDTVTYEPIYIDFDMGYAVVCDAETSTGNVLTHAINGTQPYQYYLYDNADLAGNLLSTSSDGNFYNIALAEGQQVSVLAIDSCQNSFSINMVVTSLSQSTLAWETGYAPGEGHCEGDSAFLTALPFTQSVNYHWLGPNGFESSERDNTVFLPYGSESGWYTVEITNTGCQTSFTDSVYIEVLHAPTIEILSDTTLCAGSEVELAFVPHSNGTVQYTLHHSGAPQSGEISFTAQEGEILHHTFPIWGDNLFWITGATDERCSNHYPTDTTRIQVFGIETNPPADIHPVDGYACHGYAATLQASAGLTPPFFVNWYDTPTQETLLQRDTVWSATQLSAYTIPELTGDTTLYVTLSNAGRCASLYGAVHHSVNMGSGTVTLQSGEGARFFDSGGEYGDYSNSEQLTQTFCTAAGGLRLRFNALDVLAGDTLFIYEGTTADPTHLLTAITHTTTHSELSTGSSCITFRFSSNWVNTASGWNIDILTDVAMTEVYAYIIPPYEDTVRVEVCPSEEPYTVGLFTDLDISVPGLHHYDSLFISTIGCDSTVHLELQVRPWQHISVCPDTTIYTDDTAMLWAAGADHYLWTPSESLSADDTDTTYAMPEHTTTYYVTGFFDGNPCTADTFVVVTVTPRNIVNDYVTVPMNLSTEIHPLENDTISCDDVVPEILTGPNHGSMTLQGTVVTYQPLTGYTGLDTITYSVECHDTTGRARIFILVQPYPDNVDSADCVSPPTADAWSIRQSAVSTVSNAITVSVPIVGDFDGDDEPEVLIPQATSGNRFSTVGVYKADGTQETQFAVANSYIWNSLAMGKVQMTPDVYQPIVVTFASDRHLYAYDYNGTQLWRSDQAYSSHNGESISLPSIAFADFNHDGWSEVFIGGEIYDAATGVLLCKTNGNTGHSLRNWDNTVHSYQSAASDLTGDFGLDLAAGNTIYHVNLQSRTNFALNSMEVAMLVDSARMRMEDNSEIPFADGNTFVVDINLDGRLDVLVMNVDQGNHILYLYVWDTRTGEILCSKKIPNSTKFGVPQIGDIDNDGAPEVCFIVGTSAGHNTGSNDQIYALKYNAASPNREMDVFWMLPHSDNSGSTGLTLFDFNQDGYSELIYRDLSNLRIINGSLVHHQTQAALTAPYDLATIACASATGIEYPVVADVDLDGEAEIVVSGATSSSDFGYLYFFKSDGSTWAPARHVWNQYAYNITNVNDDGSIPLYQFNNAALLPDHDNPSEWHRPFNNFLQQGTSIDRYGEPYATVPDVAVGGTAAISYYPDSVTINISYCNNGDNILNAPYEIAVYLNAYRDTVLWVDTVEAALPVDSCVQYSFSLPQAVICTHRSLTNFVVAVNDGGTGVAQTGGQQGECDTLNNFASVEVTIAHDTSFVFDTIVENQLPYTVSGLVFEEAGTDEITLLNRHGCDSTVIVDLFVWPNVSTEADSTVCDDALPLSWNGRTFTQAGTDSALLVAHSGADSTVYMTLYVHPTNHTLLYDTICQGGDYDLYHFDISSPETDTYGHSVHYQYLTNHWQCDSTVELHLFVAPVPQPEFVPEPDQMLLSEGGLFTFHNATDISTLSGETYHWHWDFGDGSSDNTTSYDFEHTYTTWGEFLVTLSLQIYECEASVSHSVYIEADLQFPNIITPNGDGKNDVFAIVSLDVEQPNHLVIYNRWGKKVFECDNYQTYARDGVIYNEENGFSASNLSDGVYFYTFHYQGKVRAVDFHGTITVIR